MNFKSNQTTLFSKLGALFFHLLNFYIFLGWKDKRLVKALSTMHDDSIITITRKKKGPGAQLKEVQKPECIIEYNKYISGVDSVDQMISYYPFTQKTLK